MKQIDRIDIRLWPLKLSARGNHAISAIKWPLAAILFALAVAILCVVVVRMTGDQSRALDVGDRVRWGQTTTDLGTVTEKNWAGVTIRWDSRSSEQAILHNDMAQVERVPTKIT